MLLLILASFYIATKIFHIDIFAPKYTKRMDCKQLQNFINTTEENCNKYGTCFYGYINLTNNCYSHPPGYYFIKVDYLPGDKKVKLVKIK